MQFTNSYAYSLHEESHQDLQALIRHKNTDLLTVLPCKLLVFLTNENNRKGNGQRIYLKRY